MTARPWYERFGAIADKPDDDDEQLLRHRFMLVTATAMSFGGLVWGTLSLVLDLPGPGLIPYAYTAVTMVNLGLPAGTKDFGPRIDPAARGMYRRKRALG